MTQLIIERVERVVHAQSSRARRIAMMFGLDAHHAMTILNPMSLPLPEGGVVLVTGPSGCGKSTLLDHARRITDLPTVMLGEHALDEGVPIVDLFAGTVDEALWALSRAGLSEARLLISPAEALSDGERTRLRLALAMHDAARFDRALIIADEFAALLDRITARNVATRVGCWIASTRHTLLMATPREDLSDAISPRVVVRGSLDGGMQVACDA